MTRREIEAGLKAAGIEEYKEEARLLFCHFSGMSAAMALSARGADCTAPLLPEAVLRRQAREPLAYILGEVGFYRETYKVSPACLIPRRESELLVEWAEAHLPHEGCFADLCTGSGCIAISLAAARPDARGMACDISGAALALAQENAQRNGVAERLSFKEADLLHGDLGAACYDLILANPPYVTEEEWADVAPELHYEPENAFLGGADGLVFYRRFLSRFGENLAEGGSFVFEIGYRQAKGLSALAEEYHYTLQVMQDYAGLDRMAILKKT